MLDGSYQRLGNYRIIRQLGSGGFAVVYLGEHVYLQTLAAIKMLRMQVADNDLECFLAEARTIARLRHPSIVGLLEFGIEDHTPFLAMDYAPHGSLRQRLPRGVRLSPAEIVPYIRQIATGLQYAHDEKLIHRDIKPENLLLGADDNVLLSDFGTALIAQTHYQQSLEIAGTPIYMAPEQLKGRPLQASDQYALGIIVYEWLSGFPPFRGSFLEVASHHLSIDPPSLSAKFPDIPPAVEQVVMTALTKNPLERFANVQEFARNLEEACQSGVASLTLPSFSTLLHSASSSTPTRGTTQPALQTPRQLPEMEPPQSFVPVVHHVLRRWKLGIVSRVMLFFLLAALLIGGGGLFYFKWVINLPGSSIGRNYPAQIYATATSDNPNYVTSMSQNDPSWNWEEGHQYDGVVDGNCVFKEGAFYASSQKNAMLICLAQGTDINDFAYQVQMTISAGDEGGLIFRSDGYNYYFFSISQNGHYSLYYLSMVSSIRLATGSSPSINRGLNQTNVLTVIARGKDIFLYVNNHYITHVTDSNRLSGSVGVFARYDTSATTVQFSNAKIWNLS